jgi:replicative DNA helicase
MGDMIMDTIKMIERLYERKELVTGVPTGFLDLDRMTAGLQPSDLIIVASRPSMGKTAMVLNVAQYVALQANTGVGIFSLEMSKEQLVMRMLCSEARVDNAKVRTGYLGERDFPRLAMAAGRLAEAPIFIDDTPAQNVLEVRAKARRLKREANIGLVIIDYLQLMRGLTAQENRTQELSEISRSLKSLAKELNVPVVALSQLNRQVEQRADKRPMMSDIRESGALEQDADVIMFIYRDEVYKPDSQDEGVAEVIVGKQRNGPTGTVRLAFRREYTRFDNLVENMEPAGETAEEG